MAQALRTGWHITRKAATAMAGVTWSCMLTPDLYFWHRYCTCVSHPRARLLHGFPHLTAHRQVQCNMCTAGSQPEPQPALPPHLICPGQVPRIPESPLSLSPSFCLQVWLVYLLSLYLSGASCSPCCCWNLTLLSWPGAPPLSPLTSLCPGLRRVTHLAPCTAGL